MWSSPMRVSTSTTISRKMGRSVRALTPYQHGQSADFSAESSERPAYPCPPRDLTLAVNLKGAVSTCEIAQEYWKLHPAAPGEGTKRRLIVLSSMGGQTAIPAGVSGFTLYRPS